MYIGDTDYNIGVFIVIILLLISLVANIFLFLRGHQSYSVKYNLYLNSPFFRQHPYLCQTIEVLYHIFFAVPFILLFIVAVMRATSNPIEFLTIVVNGLIVLLTIYPIKNKFFYLNKMVIWILAVVSQLNTLYLYYNTAQNNVYTLLCSIFYPINCILFCLALLAHQQDYFQLNQAITLCEEQLRAIYPQFVKQIKQQDEKQNKDRQSNREIMYEQKQQKKKKQFNIPKIFNGGLYGLLCRQRGSRNLKRTIIYIISLCILGLNAYLVWLDSATPLGIIGLITNFVYDIFIFAFTALKTSARSVRNTFLLVFIGRLLSFVFGITLWIFGYCFLYMIVGLFVGRIIVNTRFPLKKKPKTKSQRHRYAEHNALKTPEFVLFILTAEIFILVTAASFGVGSANVYYEYSTTIKIPLWQFALIAVIATWIIIIFMISLRMIQRQRNNIHDNVQYYFGIPSLRQMHIYMLVTYLIIAALGVYCYKVLLEPTVFFSCLFLPLILLAFIKLDTEWVKNEYQVLADIKQYNERVEKAKKVIDKKKIALSNQRIHKGTNIQSFQKIPIKPLTLQPFQNSGSGLMGNDLAISETSTQMEQEQAIEQELTKLGKQELQLVQIQHNWRTYQGKIGVIQFFRKFLTSSDRWILLMILLITVLSVSYALITYFVAGTVIGIFIILDLLTLVSYSPFYRYGKTYKQPEWKQYAFYYFGWATGIVYWCFYRNFTGYALIWAVLYIICSGAAVAYGLFRNIKKTVIYMILANITLTAVFVCLLLFFTVEIFIATLVTIVLFLLAVGAVPVAYNHLEGSTPTHVKVICGFLILTAIVGMALMGYILKVANNFAIFSFVMVAIYIVLFVIASALFYERQQNKYQTPHVYSAYGRPVYKFESRTQKLKSSISHVILYDVTGMMVIVYAAVVTLTFQEKQYGVYALGYYTVVSFLQDILFSIKTHNELGEDRQKLTKQLICKALTDLHTKYMIDFHTNPGSKVVDDQKNILKEQAQKIEKVEQLNNIYSVLARKHQQWINVSEQQQKFLFFWTVLIEFNVFTQRKAQMLKVVTETKQIQASLMEYGIFIESLNYAISDFATKYQLVIDEIQNLHPLDYVNYQTILKQHQELSKKREQEQRKKAQLEQELHRKRQLQIFEQMKRQQQIKPADQINVFNQLIQSVEPKKKYQDKQFLADQSTLGSSLNSIVYKWRRPRRGETLVKGEINAFDVKQGRIGDCYLISSMGVLGEKWIKQSMGMGDGKIWKNQKGAYMVRFYKFLKEVYIIVDDLLPVDEHDDFVFARSEDAEEIWPCIVQKAYAKLYGGYFNIVQGKCHRVFAQFTGGFPSELNIEEYKSNPNSLWQKIIDSNKNKYLLAAGSPSHPDGDRAHSARGIVQGHAYCILNVREIQGYKLIQMKNPHGSGGTQWTGDFSDSSELMSKRLMQLLGHQKKDDGVFWMSIQDFIKEFKFLYLCAIFDQQWLHLSIQGEFTDDNSYGTPNKSDQTFRNPQYGIRVTKKCTFFVNMTQQAEDSISGKNTIYLRIQKNEAKRLCKHNLKTDLLCGQQLRPINAITLSNEAILQADSYPYTFTLFVSCKDQGDTGTYALEMYCSDKDMEIIKDEDFDRQLF